MSNNYLVQKEKKKAKKRRANVLLLSREGNRETIFNIHEKMPPLTYVQSFNLYLTRLRDAEYKVKHPEIFTWKQTEQHLNKLKAIPLFKELEMRRLRRDKNKYVENERTAVNDSKTENENLPAGKRLQKGMKTVKNIILPLNAMMRDKSFESASRESTIGDESSSPTRRRRRRSAPMYRDFGDDYKPVDLAKYNFTNNIRPRKSYSITKLQTSLIGAKNASVPDIHNFEYMQDHFNRRNGQTNKILSQSELNTKQLSIEYVKTKIFKKLEVVNKNFKLHQFLPNRERVSTRPLTERLTTNEKTLESTRLGNNKSVHDFSPIMAKKKSGGFHNKEFREIISLLDASPLTKVTSEFDKEPPSISRTQTERGRRTSLLGMTTEADALTKTRRKGIFAQSLVQEPNKPKNLLRNLKMELKKLDSKLNLTQHTQEGDNTINNSRLYMGTRNLAGQSRGGMIDSPNKVTKPNVESARRKAIAIDLGAAEPRRRKGTIDSTDEEPKSRGKSTGMDKGKRQNVFLIEGQENSGVLNTTQVAASATTIKPALSAFVPTTINNIEKDEENPYENILNYKAYFKKHYMESAVNFQMSKALKEKMNSFGKTIKDAINDLQNK